MGDARKHIAGAIVLVCAAICLSSCSGDPQKAKARYITAGHKYMQKGQYGEAAIEFRNVLRLDPRSVDAYYQLAHVDLALHDWNSAYASLDKTIELDPSHLDARLDRGRLYLAALAFDRAEDDANFVLSKESMDVGAYQLLGAAMIGERKPDQAIAAFSQVTELLPDDPIAYVNMASVEISLHRYADAERHLRKAVGVDPRSIQAYSDLANFYQLQNRIPEALQVLHEGTAKNPDATSLYIDWASVLARQGSNADSDAVLDKLRQQFPNSSDVTLAIGAFYLEWKQAGRALGEYRRGLSISPKNFDIKKRIQDLYLSTNQTQLAADLDRELMKSAPKDVIVRLDHGRLLMSQGKLAEAINILQEVTVDAPDSAQAHYFLAMAHWQKGDLGQAGIALLDAVKASSDNPIALQALARLSLLQGDALDARNYAQELVQKYPADPANRQLLAEALTRLGQLRPAEEQILVAKQLAPNDPLVHLNAAYIYSVGEKWSEAQNEFEAALQLDPHNTKALGQLAELQIARMQSGHALDRVLQYVTGNPNDASGHVILGEVNFQLKNYNSAEAEYGRAIQIDPKDQQAYLKLGEVFQVDGQTERALASYQQGLNLQSQFAPLITVIGNVYLSKGDLETARKYYARALVADPNFAVANANMAWIDAQEGRDLDVALEMAKKAKSMMPELSSVTDTLAWVMYKSGNYAGAVPLLRECVQKSPDMAECHYHFGMTLLATGQEAKGKEQLEAALRMKLDSTDAQQAQQTLAKGN